MRVTFQEVGGARKLLVCAMRICTCTHANSICQILHSAKKSWKIFSPMACIGEIGENFHIHGNSQLVLSLALISSPT